MAKIFILAAIIRLVFINQHDFWFDEAVSMFVANQPTSALLTTAALDNHPPLYFLLLKIWSMISTDYLFLRLLSIILGSATIAVAYKLFSKLTNDRIAFLATILFALSPLHVYYSTEVRMYSLLVLTTLLSILFYLKFIKTRSTNSLFYLFLASILALYTHYYAILVILSLNVLFFIHKKGSPLRKKWILSQAALALSFFPWLFYSLQFAKPDCWCFNPLIGIPAAFASFNLGGLGIVTLKDFVLYGSNTVLWIFVIAFSLSFILFVKGVFIAKKAKNITLLLLFLTPLSLATLTGFFIPLFSPRALIIISPFYYLLISLGIYSYRHVLGKNLKFLTIGLFAMILIIQFMDPFFQKLPDAKEYLLKDILFFS